MLSFIRSLQSMVRSSNSVAIITFPPSLLSPSFCKRWQHMADTLLSVKAIQGFLPVYTLCLLHLFFYFKFVWSYWSHLMLLSDEDKELAQLLTGYQDMVGFLNVHKVARINTQVY